MINKIAAIASYVPSQVHDELTDNLAAARAPATRTAYAAAWQAFSTFTAGMSAEKLPAAAYVVALYLAQVGRQGAPATVRLHAAAIAAFHRDAGHENPCVHIGVRRTIQGHQRRNAGAQAQALPLDATAAEAAIAAAEYPRIGRGGRLETTRQAARRAAVDIALIRVMRDAMLRRTEAAALVWEDIQAAGDGSGRLRVRISKTDASGAGAVLYLSPAAMTALADIPEKGPEFPVFGLSPAQICRRIAKAAKVAGLPDGFSGHSPRIGMAIDLARAGTGLPQLMQAGRWQSPRMPASYTRNEAAGSGAVAQWYQIREI